MHTCFCAPFPLVRSARVGHLPWLKPQNSRFFSASTRLMLFSSSFVFLSSFFFSLFILSFLLLFSLVVSDTSAGDRCRRSFQVSSIYSICSPLILSSLFFFRFLSSFFQNSTCTNVTSRYFPFLNSHVTHLLVFSYFILRLEIEHF